MDTGIQKAEEKLIHVSSNKEVLRVYQMREMALSDWTSGLNQARREGKLEGIEEGRLGGIEEGIQKGKLEIARNLKNLGLPFEKIAGGTGLSVEDITKL